MKADLFRELLASTEQALRHARGKRVLRTTALPGPPAPLDADAIRALRDRVNASQAVFAHYLNVSTKLVQAWEASRRTPEGAALRLLELAVQQPKVVFPGLAVRRESLIKARNSRTTTPRPKSATAKKTSRPRKLVSA
jgi:putative transcriptional regulator